MDRYRLDFASPVLPAVGCLSLLSVLLFLFLMPFLFVDMMHEALSRLHLTSGAAILAVLGILLGSVVNIPVHRVEREEVYVVHPAMAVWGIWWLAPRLQRSETIIAVNVGGCVIPVLIAAWQLPFLLSAGANTVLAAAFITAANVVACYAVARPVKGIGIIMPAFVSPLVCISLTWLLLSAEAPERASAAFVAGVLGPLVGADLLHLKDVLRVPTGILSIGGAGTFDGIVLSGVLAALLV